MDTTSGTATTQPSALAEAKANIQLQRLGQKDGEWREKVTGPTYVLLTDTPQP